MSNIQFGVSQTSKPAPAGYRNFSNAMIIFVLPAAGILISGWDMADKTAKHLLMILNFAPALIKGIGTFLGNGQYYTSDPKSADVAPPASETKP